MKILLGLLILLESHICFAEESIALKANDIKNLVETRNDRVASKVHQTQAMEKRQGFLKRSFLPSLKLYGAQERFQLGDSYRRTQPTYGAEMSVNIFNGTKDSLTDKVVDKKKERANADKRVVLYEEIIKAKEIYWNLVYLSSALSVMEEIQKLNLSNIKSAKNRIKAGVTTAADRYEFEMKDTEIQRNIEQIRMQQKILERELLVLLGYEENKKITLQDKMEHAEKMEVIGDHSEIQHQFLAKPSILQAEENELSAKMQSRSWWPRVDAYLAQNMYNVRNGNNFNDQEGKETVVGVRLTMNLFDFTSGNKEASALKAEAQGSKSEASYLLKKIENEAHSEIVSIQFLHQQIHAAEENIQRAQGYLKLTLSEYSRGVKNSPDVIGSLDKVFETKTKYYEILRDFYITRDHLRSKTEI
jgi:outer membrane protein